VSERLLLWIDSARTETEAECVGIKVDGATIANNRLALTIGSAADFLS